MTTTNIDQQVRDMIAKVNQRQEEVDAQRATVAKSWATTCTYKPIGHPSTINIQTANFDQILEVGVDLQLRSTAISDVSARLKYDFPQKIQGSTADQWFSDLEKRLAKIGLAEEEKALDTLKLRLNKVLSPEERRRIEVEMLMKEI